jgi:hypothetical protein
MDLAVAGSYAEAPNGAWDIPYVSLQRDALIRKGAAQGWLIPRQDLNLGCVIGAGTFGQTYEAEWRSIKVQHILTLVCHP